MLNGRRLGALGTAAAIVALVVLVYGVTLQFGLLWDDHLQIEQNPWLRGTDGWKHILTRPSWSFLQAGDPQRTNYYRPLFLGTYALVARLAGVAATPYHALSLALHAVVSMLVAWVSARWNASRAAGAFAGLLFALHPAQAESVAWVAAQGDLVCALCVLVALLAESGSRGPVRTALVFVGTLGACLAKETGMGLLVVLGVCAWLPARGSTRSPRAWLSEMWPALSASAVYALMRWQALGHLVPMHHAGVSTPVEAAALAGALAARHALMLVCPFALEPQLFVHLEHPVAAVVATGWGLAVVLAGLLWRGVPAPVLRALAATIAFVLPTLDASALGRINFAERYAYLPLIGLACLAGWGLGHVHPRAVRIAACVLLLGTCAYVTRDRVERYRDDLHYFSIAVRVAPGDAAARNGLGIALERAGEFVGAEREYRAALALEPGLAVAWTNLGGLLEERGDASGALEAWQRACVLDPNDAIAPLRLARLHRQAGNASEAARALDDVLAHGFASYDLLAERAVLWIDGARPREAEALLRRAVRDQPERPRAFYLLAQALYAQDRLAEAERAALDAIERGAGPGPRRLLALMLARQGDERGARRWLEAALALAPDDPETHALRRRLRY